MILPNEIDMVRNKKKKKERDAFIVRNYGINFLYTLFAQDIFVNS